MFHSPWSRHAWGVDRRRFFGACGAATVWGMVGFRGGLAHAADSLTREQRDQLTPAEIIELAKAGNERFRSGRSRERDFLREQASSAAGQFPAAVILSCVDSRTPAEIILDIGIGDSFNARVAGNIANTDILGSMEFACAAAGAKVVLVMGHTACGAIKGAIDDVQLGNLTSLLAKIRPAMDATTYEGDRSSQNASFVDAVAKSNVEHTITQIRTGSSVLRDLEHEGKLKITGAMYDLKTAKVEFLA